MKGRIVGNHASRYYVMKILSHLCYGSMVYTCIHVCIFLLSSTKSAMSRVCPGCHGTDFMTFGDGFGDGDFWFHCFTCGTEECVDHEDSDKFFSGSQPPKKSPPYKNTRPLPRDCSWPGAMTPDQIRNWMARNRIRLHPSGRVKQKK